MQFATLRGVENSRLSPRLIGLGPKKNTHGACVAHILTKAGATSSFTALGSQPATFYLVLLEFRGNVDDCLMLDMYADGGCAVERVDRLLIDRT